MTQEPQLTKHTHPVVFGRREAGCPRCAELEAGAPVRTSPKWEAVNRRRAYEEQDRRWWEQHRRAVRRLGYCPRCQAPGPGPVCTAQGDDEQAHERHRRNVNQLGYCPICHPRRWAVCTCGEW